MEGLINEEVAMFIEEVNNVTDHSFLEMMMMTVMLLMVMTMTMAR